MARTKRKSGMFRGSKKRLVVGLLLIGLLSGAFYFSLLQPNQSPTTGKNPVIAEQDDYVNLNPPTKTELEEAARQKQAIANETTPSPPTNSNGKKQVSPVITSANSQQINAYVPGIFEEGGICTATLTKGSRTVTKSSKGFQNASYTSCAPIDVGGLLSPGNWTVVVSYSSTASEGQSKSMVFEVND